MKTYSAQKLAMVREVSSQLERHTRARDWEVSLQLAQSQRSLLWTRCTVISNWSSIVQVVCQISEADVADGEQVYNESKMDEYHFI